MYGPWSLDAQIARAQQEQALRTETQIVDESQARGGTLQCIADSSDVGGIVGAIVAGGAAIAAGAPILPYSWFGPAVSGGGRSGGTSIISASARGLMGKGFFPGGDFVTKESGGAWRALMRRQGTASKAAIVGRVALRASIVVGAGLELYGAYTTYQAYQACKQ